MERPMLMAINKPIFPCKDCKDRYPACHDKCEKYKESLKEYHRLEQLTDDCMSAALLTHTKATAERYKVF